MTAVWELLGDTPFAEDVERVMEVFVGVAVPRARPFTLRLRVAEDHAFVEFTAARESRPQEWEDYGLRMSELAQIATRFGHSHLSNSDVWWARIGVDE